MAIHDNYYPSSVSRHLLIGERSWDQAVYQSGKPVLDAELIFNQEVSREVSKLLWQSTVPSGWLRGPAPRDPLADFLFPPVGHVSFVSDAFWMTKLTALVAGMPVVVEYTNTTTAGANLLQLSAAPVFGGAPPDVKRTDFIFLEVWKALVSDSPNASGTVTILAALPSPGDIITIGANNLVAVAGAPAIDQFTIGADEATTAANIAAAINLSPPNSFTNVTAASDGIDTVTITSVVSGTAGNAIALGVTGLGMTASGPFLTGGVDEPNKPSQDTLYRHGNVEAPSGVNLPDDIADPLVGTETTKRVQIQYRIRVTGQSEAVSFKGESDGFSNPNVLAQGTQVAPVANYPFVPADNTTVTANSSAVAYDIEDNGLWIAGDGTQAAATALGTLDGFVYAIPLAFVFRRNDAYNGGAGSGFAPLDNTNGGLPSTHPGFVNPVIGVIPAGDSDRPDGNFHDALVRGDVLDLRRHVIPGGMDMSAELNFQMQSLLDGSFGTWAVDMADKQDLGAGSGDVSWRYLVCNEVGRSAAEGGNPPASGDTTRGVSIANFDHVRRRFGDQPTVERVVFEFIPSYDQATYPGKYVIQANPGWFGWAEDDELNLDLSQLNATTIGDWDPAGITYTGGSGGSVFGFAPPGTTITDILSIRHDDGNYNASVTQAGQAKLVTGLGTSHLKVTLDANPTLVTGGVPGPTNRMVGDVGLDDGSQRRIFLEVEITYPLGAGTTDTPDEELSPDPAPYPDGPIIENDTTQRPVDWEDLRQPRFRTGYREVAIEYVANDGSGVGSGAPLTDEFVSEDPQTLILHRRLYGSGALLTGVTDQVDLQPRAVDNALTEWGSSSRTLVLDISTPAPKIPLSGAGQTLAEVTYFSQDPIPNYGAAGGGYQVAVYFRSNAPQTAGTKAGSLSLPDPITVAPLLMSPGVWTGTCGMGSADVPYPYTAPMDQIPVNADTPIGSYPGEWYFAGTAQISVDDFSADTGLLNLHPMLPADATGEFTFQSADRDVEFRSHYKVSDTSAYRPTIFAQPLSNVERHKVWMPFLARATEDNDLWRKNEVLLIVVSRFAELDDENTIRFTDSANRSCAAIYRTRGMLLIAE